VLALRGCNNKTCQHDALQQTSSNPHSAGASVANTCGPTPRSAHTCALRTCVQRSCPLEA
jgi:hypothetical protein